jgi:pyridoxamine 5'-phosphate oxidase family protein
MTAFTEKELQFIKSQRLARLATVSSKMQPDVAAVGYHYDGKYFWVTGFAMTKTMKYWNAKANPRVALIIDDLISLKPFVARGLKIHGLATIESSAEMDKMFKQRLSESGRAELYKTAGKQIRVLPELKWAWGIEGEGQFSARVRIT